MTRQEVKEKYLIKVKGEIIECFYPRPNNIVIDRNGKIFIIDANEFGDAIVLDKSTLRRIIDKLL